MADLKNIIKKSLRQSGCGKGNWSREEPPKINKIHSQKYILTYYPDHRRSDSDGYVFEHILIAEKILGKPLPIMAVIHHVNGNGLDNEPSNLVICQDNSFHLFLHQRMRAYINCGHAHWRKCRYCNEYDNPSLLSFPKGGRPYHKKCASKYQSNRKNK